MCFPSGGGAGGQGGIGGSLNVMSLVAGLALGGALSGGTGGSSNAPAPAVESSAPAPTPVANTQPDQAAVRAQSTPNDSGSAGGTLLTGGQGVSPSLLTLGQNTLLGR